MNEEVKNMKVIVHGESENPTKMNLRSGKFSMVIDEPKSMGGTDEGPSPVQALLMALTGCLNVTGHEVARQKGLQLNKLNITIEGLLNPAAFMGISNKERAGFQTITVELVPDFENASAESINNWLEETEKRCPVTDNILHETQIIVAIKEA